MQKNLLYLFSFLFAVWVLLPSCRKIDRDTVAGHVLEYGTDKPIEGARVKLYGWGGSPLSGGIAFTVDSTTTDSKGRYEFNDHGQFELSMTTNAKKDLYWTDYDSERVVADGHYEDTDIHLKPFAWLKIKAVNETGNYGFFRGPYYSYSSGLEVKSYIAKGDSLVYHSTFFGNTERPFQFGIRKDEFGTPMHNLDSVQFYIGNQLTAVVLGSGLSVGITPSGHDTTNITIFF